MIHLLQRCNRYAAAILLILASRADARPNFGKIFESTYENEYAGTDVKTHSCTICHLQGTKDKRVRNNYGDAVAETMQDKDRKDMDAIRQALKEAEDKPSAVPGKTFGDLIREGKLPASK